MATAVRSTKRASYSASVLRPPGQLPARRSCQTTTSASSPITPPWSLCSRSGAGAQPAAAQHPVEVGQAQEVARLGADLPLRIRRRAARTRLEHRGGERAGAGVGDAVAHDDHRHVAAVREPDQQLGGATTAGPVRTRQDGTPDERARPRRRRRRWPRCGLSTGRRAPRTSRGRRGGQRATRCAPGGRRRRPGAARAPDRAAPAAPRRRRDRGRGGCRRRQRVSAAASRRDPRRPGRAGSRSPSRARG